MEKTRTLPPLVRGRVTAVLDFYVDKISVGNISVLMDSFDLIVRVQWWGEDLPTYIRPKKACYQRGGISEKSDSVEMNFQYARYEIKTTLELFKLYLKTCEVLELCVLDAVKMCVIGSAFLRDLVNLLNQSNNFVTAPIFDYLGEEIGEVVICISFLDKMQQNVLKKHEEIFYPHKNNCSGKLNIQNLKISNRTKKSCYTPTGNHFFNNRFDEINFGELAPDLGLSVEKCASKETEKIVCFSYGQGDKPNNVPKKIKTIFVNEKKVPEGIISSCKCLPEIITASDTSKILYFGVSPQKNRRKMLNNNNNPKIGVRNKFNSNSIKCKSKSKHSENLSSFPSDQNLYVGEVIKKSPLNEAIIKDCQREATKVTNIKQFKVSSAEKSLQSEKHLNPSQTFVEDGPSKQSVETKVLDFLLGSDLSKEDEESAVNEFKQMSPSHNLVMSVNQLCLTSDSSESHKSRIGYGTDSLGSPQPTGLTFDFNNPIERNYYEKFFLKSKFLPDLELAELLNQPENSAVLEKLKSEENISNKGSFWISGFKSNEFPLDEKNSQKPKGKENFPEHFNKVNGNVKGCVQCKYYKKLDELDKIIESLKHFERKMLLHEKGMESVLAENPKMYNKRNQLNSS